jgi:hypothetical protein
MAEEGDLRIGGKVYDPSDMTFREQREMRRIVRDELLPGEDVDFESLTLSDLIPAMAVVLVRRDKPEYTLDEALDLKLKEVYVTEDDAKLAAPPTSRGSSKKSTSARSGTPA